MSSKQIKLDLTEYNADLEKYYIEGINFGLTVVKDIFENDGKNLTINEKKADPKLLEFVEYIKGLNARLKNGTSGAM